MVSNLFQGCVDHYELQELRLDQLLIVHKLTIDKSKQARHAAPGKQTIQTNVRINRDRDLIGSGFGVRGSGYSLSNR